MKKPSIADIMSKGMGDDSDEEYDSESEGDEDHSAEEVDAMKMFERASSPEKKAEALKLFLKACGAY